MTSHNDDCYFFYYSKCIKGALCPFRHEPAALGKEQVCVAWSNGACSRVACPDRHMNILKNRTQTPCFWETQPGGCQKPHCVFFHRKQNQVPQKAVAVPAPPSTKTSASSAAEMNETGTLKKEAKVIDQKPVGGAITIQKATVAPSSDTLAAQAPLANKPTNGLEAQLSGGRTVVTSVNGVTSPKKVVIKKDEPIKNVKERLGGLNSSDECGLKFGVKTLEEIHREKALASMKKKQDDRIPILTSSFDNSKRQSDSVSAGRKIVLKNGGNSEGELSDACNSPGRKVEVTTSDTENGRVKGNVKCRLGPIAGELTPPNSGDSSPGGNFSKSKAVAEIRLVKHVSTTVLSPSKRLRKRKPDSEAVRLPQPTSKVQRVAASRKQAKPAMQIYRPPRATNSDEPEHDRFISKKPIKSEMAESSKVQTRKKVESNVVPRELPVDKTTATSLLKKPLLKDNKWEEKRVLEKVRVKTLDEILAEKRIKRSPEHGRFCEPTERSAPVASSSETSLGSSAEKRCLARKRSSEDSIDTVNHPDISDSKHSTLRLLKRRKLSVENQQNRSEVNGRASSSEEVSEDALDCVSSAPSTAKDEKQTTTCYDGKDSLLLDDDCLFDDDFLLGEAPDSFVAKTIKDDDELFEEIQSLLK